MAISKINYDGNTLMDLTSDTVAAENLDEGVTAHSASGETLVGVRKVFDVLPVDHGGTGRTDAVPIVYTASVPSNPEPGVIYAIPI